jgi:hypothetical protein
MDNPYAMPPELKLVIRTEPVPEPTHPAYWEMEARCDTFNAIDFDAGYVRMTDGSYLPIVSLKDELGDETYDPEEAVSLTASYGGDAVFVIDLSALPAPQVIH